MGPFGPASSRGKVKAAFASFQWPEESDRFGTPKRCFFKTSFRHDKCHLRRPRKDQVLSLQGNACHLAIRQGLKFLAKVSIQPALSFSNKDKVGTIQLLMVDQGNGAEIMYPNLYNGLNLRLEDLTAYDSPLVSFNGKVVIPRGQIKLLV